METKDIEIGSTFNVPKKKEKAVRKALEECQTALYAFQKATEMCKQVDMDLWAIIFAAMPELKEYKCALSGDLEISVIGKRNLGKTRAAHDND